jgi:hypothetical protein
MLEKIPAVFRNARGISKLFHIYFKISRRTPNDLWNHRFSRKPVWKEVNIMKVVKYVN